MMNVLSFSISTFEDLVDPKFTHDDESFLLFLEISLLYRKAAGFCRKFSRVFLVCEKKISELFQTFTKTLFSQTFSLHAIIRPKTGQNGFLSAFLENKLTEISC